MSDDKSTAKTLSKDYESKDFDGYFQVGRSEMLDYVPQGVSTVLDVG